MLLYGANRRATMLIPNTWDSEWTNTDRVLSDQPPTVSGTGAVLTATQALGLTVDQAAALVHSQGGTSLSSASALSSAATQRWTGAALAAANEPLAANTGRIPIPASVATATALLNGDNNRAFVLVQNNSAAGGANLLVNVDGPVDTTQPWAYLNLPPLQGILLDQNAISNPIYVAWGAGAVVGGVIMYGVKVGKVQTPGMGGGAITPAWALHV